jgi:hypothetical protein
MATPKVIHLIQEEPEQRTEGALFTTMCGVLQEHATLPAVELRERFICAMCQNAQNLEFARGLEHLRTRYNSHLESHHMVAPRKDHE